MSFVAISDGEEDIQAVSDNNPGWETKHYVNYEGIRELDVPVINIGPYGLDAHKKLERTEMTYSFEIVPNLTNASSSYCCSETVPRVPAGMSIPVP